MLNRIRGGNWIHCFSLFCRLRSGSYVCNWQSDKCAFDTDDEDWRSTETWTWLRTEQSVHHTT